MPGYSRLTFRGEERELGQSEKRGRNR